MEGTVTSAAFKRLFFAGRRLRRGQRDYKQAEGALRIDLYESAEQSARGQYSYCSYEPQLMSNG